MMTNLFTTFDPSTSFGMSLNWTSIFMPMIFFPLMFWISLSRFSTILSLIINKLNKEFKLLLKSKNHKFTLLFTSLFYLILINNMMGLLPYIFTASSHLIFSLSLSLPFWLTLMIFGWINKMKFMFAHLIPEGSPLMQTPFMACIETISNMIRPMSLAVRLTSNMIAGHLLMCLLGNNTINISYIMMPIILIIQITLMMFETAVSLIQAYVFATLSTLYTKEI